MPGRALPPARSRLPPPRGPPSVRPRPGTPGGSEFLPTGIPAPFGALCTQRSRVAGRGCRNHARHGHARPAPAPGPLSPGEAPGAGPSLPSRCPGISEQLASLRPPHEQRSDPTTLRTVPSGNSRRGRPGIRAQHPSALSLSGPTGPCSRPRSGSPLGWRRTALGSHEAGRPAGFRSHWPRGGARPDRDFWCRDAAPGFGTGRSARAAPTGRSGPVRAAPCPRAGVTERRLQTIPIGTGTAGRDVSPSPRLCSRLGTAR